MRPTEIPYAYALSNPVSLIDPGGHKATTTRHKHVCCCHVTKVTHSGLARVAGTITGSTCRASHFTAAAS